MERILKGLACIFYMVFGIPCVFMKGLACISSEHMMQVVNNMCLLVMTDVYQNKPADSIRHMPSPAFASCFKLEEGCKPSTFMNTI